MFKFFFFIVLVVSSCNASCLIDSLSIHLCNLTADGDLPVAVGNYSIQKDEVKKFIFDFKIVDLFKLVLRTNGTAPNITDVKSIDEKKELKILIKGFKLIPAETMKKAKMYLNEVLLKSIVVNVLKGKFPCPQNTTATAVTNVNASLPVLESDDSDLNDLGGDLGGSVGDDDDLEELLVPAKNLTSS